MDSMNQERLAALITAHRTALAVAQDSTSANAHATILGILQELDKGEITTGHAQRLLGEQALRATDEPAQATLYRQAAADLRQLQRGEH